MAQGIQQLDGLFATTLQRACDELPLNAFEDDYAEVELNAKELTTLDQLATFLTESLVQIGPLTAFVKIYQDIRSNYLVVWFKVDAKFSNH